VQRLRIGIIGAGLMGREFASAAARWCHLVEPVAEPVITAVASRTDKSVDWFRRNVSTVRTTSTDYCDVLADGDVDAVYCAVPHDLHERVFVEAIEAGKHLLGEKPFGIDRAANRAIAAAAAKRPDLVVRCVSQFPFFPGAQRVFAAIRDGRVGRVLEVEAGFQHCSDLDPDKKINWKRMVERNGEYGCMGDLGMHVLHIPLRAGWRPANVRAILSNVRPDRPNDEGVRVPCDTWDNATLLCEVDAPGGGFPMTLKYQRVAPGQTNTWYIRVVGERHCAAFTLKTPRTLRTLDYEPGEAQVWKSEDLGYESVYPTISGRIFEFGFGDAIQQMFAAFCEQVVRGNDADVPFGCATMAETSAHHAVLTAALASHRDGSVARVDYDAAG